MQYMVVCQQVVGNERDGYSVAYNLDARRFDRRREAISHGFEIRGSDDFNIAVVDGERLLSFDWMDEPIGEPPDVLREIEAALFPVAA